ncbi:interferon regulatory factor 7 isoform X2 [Phyllobates terribilis]|uniref:interferon regulatory factor 7 isoform X2 n=1 Tax=Phyllobates terribilis TaxID=111132 RepID=UPI003CCB29E3
MPRRERELFGPWLIRQINSNNFDGVCWLDGSRTLFRLPWKHLNMSNKDEKDYRIFKAWAIHSRKYTQNCEDPPTWKTNFRCALNQVHYRNKRMFTEHEDKSSDQRDPHKIYRFNGDHHDMPASNPSGAILNEAPNNQEEQNFHNGLNEEDFTLRISPDSVLDAPFARAEDSDNIAELIRNILLEPTENNIEQVLNLSQDGYLQREPLVDEIFRSSIHEQWTNSQQMESYVVNGHEQTAHEEPSIHIPVFGAQYQMCNIYQNGFPQDVAVHQGFQQISAVPQFQHPPVILNGYVSALHEPQVAQCNGYHQESAHDLAYQSASNGCQQDTPRVRQSTNSSLNYSYHTNNEENARSSPVGHVPPQVNGSESASPPQTQAASLNLQRSMPPLTSWEVTVYYRGKEVLKQNVSKKFFILRDVSEVQMEHADTIQFPSTDELVDQVQIKATNEICNYVEKGLLLEVNPENFKVYATRMGRSRVYWSLSESVKTKEMASQAKKLIRDDQTEIFDFSQFWEELKGYRNHKRSSPDYTIYMAFGEELFEPVMKRLVLVKLVPNLCTFLHQAAQQNGASSLHSELISLQISHGSSFNSFDLNDACLMDFQDLF